MKKKETTLASAVARATGQHDPAVQTVPKTHPIAAAFPHELDVPITLRLDSIKVEETFETGTSKVLNSAERVIEHTRHLTARYEILLGARGFVQFTTGSGAYVEGSADLDGLTFDAAGNPSDPAKWATITREILETAIEDAKLRVSELIDAGVDAEESETTPDAKS